jgi:hypothetical protein
MNVTTNSILIIKVNKGLIRLNCPFNVKCIVTIKDIKTGAIKEVISVHSNPNGLLVYRIEMSFYYYYYFIILVDN